MVSIIHPEAIAAFVAIMESKNKDNHVSGNIPQDRDIIQRLHDFGFFDWVDGGPKLGTPTGHIRLGHSGKTVDGKIASEVVVFGLKKLGLSQSKHGPTYNVFTEAMANTFQHASKKEKGHQTWWAAVYYDKERHVACFTAIDLGVGILKSRAWSERAKAFVSNASQGERLRMLLNGEIPSRTGDNYRGRGLPSIKRACDQERIMNLSILSNKALAQVADREYRELSVEFRGTVVYWELQDASHEEEIT